MLSVCFHFNDCWVKHFGRELNTFSALHSGSNHVLHRVYYPKISSLSRPLTISRDKILQPPAAPIKTPVKQLQDRSEVDEIIPEYFTKLSDGWGVVYRQDVTAHDYEQFLCMNWVVHRLKNDLRPGQRFPIESPMETVKTSIEEMGKLLASDYDLVPCTATDAKRVCEVLPSLLINILRTGN
jgi:hypothetical protein